MLKYIKKLGQSLGLTNVEPVYNSNSSENKEWLADSLFQKEQIEGSPFWAIGNKDSGYYLTMRNIRLSEKLKSIKEVKDYLHTNSYNCIISAILCILDIKAAEEQGRQNGTLNHNHKNKIQ